MKIAFSAIVRKSVGLMLVLLPLVNNGASYAGHWELDRYEYTSGGQKEIVYALFPRGNSDGTIEQRYKKETTLCPPGPGIIPVSGEAKALYPSPENGYGTYDGRDATVNWETGSYAESKLGEGAVTTPPTATGNINYNVRAIFKWRTETNEPPTDFIYVREHATIAGGEMINQHDGWGIEKYNAYNPFRGQDFEFSNVNNGFGDPFVLREKQPGPYENQGSWYQAYEPHYTKIASGGLAEVNGPSRAMTGTITMKPSYAQEPFDCNGSAIIWSDYRVGILPAIMIDRAGALPSFRKNSGEAVVLPEEPNPPREENKRGNDGRIITDSVVGWGPVKLGGSDLPGGGSTYSWKADTTFSAVLFPSGFPWAYGYEAFPFHPQYEWEYGGQGSPYFYGSSFWPQGNSGLGDVVIKAQETYPDVADFAADFGSSKVDAPDSDARNIPNWKDAKGQFPKNGMVKVTVRDKDGKVPYTAQNTYTIRWHLPYEKIQPDPGFQGIQDDMDQLYSVRPIPPMIDEKMGQFEVYDSGIQSSYEADKEVFDVLQTVLSVGKSVIVPVGGGLGIAATFFMEELGLGLQPPPEPKWAPLSFGYNEWKLSVAADSAGGTGYITFENGTSVNDVTIDDSPNHAGDKHWLPARLTGAVLRVNRVQQRRIADKYSVQGYVGSAEFKYFDFGNYKWMGTYTTT